MKKYSWLLFALIFVFSAAMATAQPDRQEQKIKHKEHRGQVCEKLKLTDTQKQQLQTQRSDMQKQAVQLQAKLKTAQIELRDLMIAENPDKDAIGQKLGDIEKIKTSQKLLRVNNWFDVKKILTPEQQKIWKTELGKMLAEGHGKMHRRQWRHDRSEE